MINPLGFLKPFDWGTTGFDLNSMRPFIIPKEGGPKQHGDDYLNVHLKACRTKWQYMLGQTPLEISGIPKDAYKYVNCADGKVRLIILPFQEGSPGYHLLIEQPIVREVRLKHQLNVLQRELATYVKNKTTPTPNQLIEFMQKIGNMSKTLGETIHTRNKPFLSQTELAQEELK